MSFWVAVFVGFLQGLTEFLPVSSSGHLSIFEKILGVETDAVFLNVLLHVATLLAVCIFYRKTLFYLIKHPFCKQNLWLMLATIPAILFVVLFGQIFDGFFSSTFFVGIGFLVSAFFLSMAQIVLQKSKTFSNLNYKKALFMGLGQAIAIFPGLSRSGTTFAFGIACGADKNQALDFSFLMSIPIIVASMVYELLFKPISFNFDVLGLVVSFAFAFLTALFGLKLMQKIVKKLNFWWFVCYLLVVGILVLVFI